MKVNSVDAIVGLQYGDEGKGKITAAVIDNCNYDLCARFNGGPNAGHSIHKQNGAHYKLHQLPSSIAYQKPGHIGAGCAVDFGKLQAEVEEFKEVEGIDPLEYLTISPRALTIAQIHKEKDAAFHATKQGSTSSGIAPAYADFYNRTNVLVDKMSYPSSKGSELIKDIQDVNTLLLEGAQGFYLDPYMGKYPFTTSSSCMPAAASASFGFSPKKIRNIIGVAKVYETRSGIDPHFSGDMSEGEMHDSVLLQEAGQEFGVTTGRKRQCRYLRLNELIHAINCTGTNILVLNKMDILYPLGIFKLIYNDSIESYTSGNEMIKDLINKLYENCASLDAIKFSFSPKNDIDWTFLNDNAL